jgi:hypothetical protein
MAGGKTPQPLKGRVVRSLFLAAIAALAFSSASHAATCRNHVTGAFRPCAPRIVKHPAVRHRPI